MRLEKVRLLGIKRQVAQGHGAVALCRDEGYLVQLRAALMVGYNTEINLLPNILDCLACVTYPKNYLSMKNFCVLKRHEGILSDNTLAWNLKESQFYVNRIDVVRRSSAVASCREKVVVNKRVIYYLDEDNKYPSSVRSIRCLPMRINDICITADATTDAAIAEYEIILFLIPMCDESQEMITIDLEKNWRGYNNVEIIACDKNLSIKIIGEDPFLVQDGVNIKAEIYRYLHIQMISSVRTDVAQVYFSTLDFPGMNQNRSVFFRMQGDGLDHSYYIDMGLNRLWEGIVDSIRIDPAHYYCDKKWGGTEQFCQITKIEFLKTKPVETRDSSLVWIEKEQRFDFV